MRPHLLSARPNSAVDRPVGFYDLRSLYRDCRSKSIEKRTFVFFLLQQDYFGDVEPEGALHRDGLLGGRVQATFRNFSSDSAETNAYNTLTSQ